MDAVDELNFLLGIGPPRPNLPLTIRKSFYTSVRDLGKGTYGQAILVFHKIRNQYYVIKHINMSKMNSKQRKDAHKEISILQQLDHPNIVRYVEYFEEFPHLYIVMEYADGGDLGTHLTRIKNNAKHRLLSDPEKDKNSLHQRNGLLTEPQVMSLFVQATIALKHMHDRRLLHRDIKSQNIFLTRNHVVKLGDFGISTVLKDTVAMASTMCGTPCYFSPEICLGKPYNNKSDVWALGVLLYEMCANRLPFESPTMKALMNEILHNEPRRIPANFSEELWELIQWMMHKDPKKRPDAQQVLMSSIVMRHMPSIIDKLKSIEDTEKNCDPVAGEKITKQLPQEDKVIDNNACFPIIENNPVDLGGDKVSGINLVGKRAEALPLNDRYQQKPAKLQPRGMRKEPKITDELSRNPNAEKEKNILDCKVPQNVYGVASYLPQQHNDAKDESERGRGRPYRRISQELPAETSEAPLQGVELEGREAGVIENLNELSPGQRAAQEIQMMQRQKPREPERMAMRQCLPGKTDKPVEFPREMHPRPLQAGLSEQLSISALIEAYDLEKKKVTSLRQKEHFLNPRQAPVAPLNQYLVNNAHQQMMHGYKALEGDLSLRGPARQVSAAPRLPPMGEPNNSILPTKDPNGRPQPQTGCGRGNSHPKDHPSGNLASRFLTPQYTPSKMDALYRAPILPPLPALNEVAMEEMKDDQNIDPTQGLPSPPEEEKNVRSELNDVVHEMTWLLSRFTMSMRGAEDKNGADAAEVVPGLDPQKATEAELIMRNIDHSAIGALKSFQDPSASGSDGGKSLSGCNASKLSNREQLEMQTASEEFLDPLGTRLDVEKLQAQPQQDGPSTKISGKESQQSNRQSSSPTSSNLECNAALSKEPTQIMLGSSLGAKSEAVPADADCVRSDSRPRASDAESRQPNSCFDQDVRGGSNAPPKTTTPAAAADQAQNSCNMRRSSFSLGKDSIQTASVVQDPPKVFISDELNALRRDSAMKYFNGGCLCGGVRVQGVFSSIYGSFVCKCNACCRVSGSCYGIEWLHLPEINHIENILNVTSPTDVAAICNEEGDNGARTLMKSPASSVAGGGKEKKGPMKPRCEVLPTPSEYHFSILVDVSDADSCGRVGIPDVDGTHFPVSKIDQSGPGVNECLGRSPCDAIEASHDPPHCLPQPRPCREEEGYFRVHFCPTCGCVLGMEHDGIDGLLLTKLLLTPTSMGVLLQFEQIIDELKTKSIV
ncbi:unnamed protein product [Phytomonas sp. EM1]|nr:unnamed protein product [Phytomonas sp. EM1]|eukprot:CCW60240.1 unnamed protein product [Phytomonas sp. isolate EM1]